MTPSEETEANVADKVSDRHDIYVGRALTIPSRARPSRCIGITLTGPDESTPVSKLVSLTEWPFVEIGLLCMDAPARERDDPRIQWLQAAATALSGRCALHVCGHPARQALLRGDLDDVLLHTPRVQVNGKLTVDEAERLCGFVRTLITQHRPGNEALLDVLAPNHVLLVDCSSGRGKLPCVWERPETGKVVGFAGGLGADNLLDQMRLIRHVAVGDYWIDMQGRLRTERHFDASKAEGVVRLFHEMVARE